MLLPTKEVLDLGKDITNETGNGLTALGCIFALDIFDWPACGDTAIPAFLADHPNVVATFS